MCLFCCVCGGARLNRLIGAEVFKHALAYKLTTKDLTFETPSNTTRIKANAAVAVQRSRAHEPTAIVQALERQHSETVHATLRVRPTSAPHGRTGSGLSPKCWPTPPSSPSNRGSRTGPRLSNDRPTSAPGPRAQSGRATHNIISAQDESHPTQVWSGAHISPCATAHTPTQPTRYTAPSGARLQSNENHTDVRPAPPSAGPPTVLSSSGTPHSTRQIERELCHLRHRQGCAAHFALIKDTDTRLKAREHVRDLVTH